MQTMTQAYNQYYNKKQPKYLYPVEFVVRTFLGHYKNHNLEQQHFPGKKILDLGYGDGRNMPLLHNLKFDIYGVEISETINQLATNLLESLGVQACLKTGSNSSIPFADHYFDYLLACHACYYVSESETFSDNLNEICRVLKPGGIFICSLPWKDTYILEGSKEITPGHYKIQNDPYKLRNGTIFRAFSNEDEIIQELSAKFQDIRIGFCNDNFYGTHQKVWIVTCWKK